MFTNEKKFFLPHQTSYYCCSLKTNWLLWVTTNYMWKEGLVRPKLKRVNVDLIKKNYRPVSNLAFLSEITEKAAALQICDQVSFNQMFPCRISISQPQISQHRDCLTAHAQQHTCQHEQTTSHITCVPRSTHCLWYSRPWYITAAPGTQIWN